MYVCGYAWSLLWQRGDWLTSVLVVAVNECIVDQVCACAMLLAPPRLTAPLAITQCPPGRTLCMLVKVHVDASLALLFSFGQLG